MFFGIIGTILLSNIVILCCKTKDYIMNIPEDPTMLYSYLNMKLRDEYPSLDALCEDMDVSKEEILEKMKSIGFEYDSERNRFW